MEAKKPTLAIVRSFGLRPFDINFFEGCERFRIVFIHCLPRNLNSISTQSIQLKLKPVFWFDPIVGLSGKYNLINLSSWAYLKGLDKYIKSVDFINTIETYFFLSRQCAKISRKYKKPLIVMVSQNVLLHPSKFVPPYSWNTKFVVNRADLFIAISQGAKSYLESLSVDEERIRVVKPGIDIKTFCPPKVRQNSKPRILFVGSLYKSKGLPELLKACKLLYKARFDHELWICGRGYLKPLVDKYSQKYPIKYLGFVEYKQLPDIYRKCDIFCLPSREQKLFGMKIGEEQFGFVFLEAMSSGLPVVTTNCGSILEVVGSKNVVIKKGSIKQLFDALRDLISDEKKRGKIGSSNRQKVKKMFNLKRQSEKFQDEIEKLS